MEAQIVSQDVQESTEKSRISIISEEAEKQISGALTVYERANGLVVVTSEDYTGAGSILKEIKDRIKRLEEAEESIIKPLREGYNKSRANVLAIFSPTKEKLEKVKTSLSKTMLEWAEEQKRKEREEERRLQEEARKRAEEEALLAALEAEQNGDKQEAEQILAEPVYVPPVKVASFVPKSKESHIRETWSAELEEGGLIKLVKAISEGKAPILSVKADMVFLNEQARSYKQALRIPGVKASSKKTQI